MRGANIGSEVTLRKNLQHLGTVGLTTWKEVAGAHGGNEFTVNLPEEIPTPDPLYPLYPLSKLEGVEGVVSTGGRGGLIVENKGGSAAPNTSSKTNTVDDEVFNLWREFVRDVTGKAATAEDEAQLSEILEVVLKEGRAAATRTSVSDAGAFLVEHLKRRFARREGVSKEGKPKPIVEAQHFASQQPSAKLSPEQIADHASIISELLQSGYSPEQAEAQFAASFHAEDWKAVIKAALACRFDEPITQG